MDRINELKKKFKQYYIGLSDHTIGIESTIASIPLGIVAVEKHFKLNNKLNSVDSKFSISPEKLKQLSKRRNCPKNLRAYMTFIKRNLTLNSKHMKPFYKSLKHFYKKIKNIIKKF